ncbi:hypothetical protein HYU17_06135 [Candidatus Woesearchaeota archaeon]|nr:hypothetical protein [Candidatus Woesearchaeota archaeon]
MILYLLPILDAITAAVLMLHTRFGVFPASVVLVHGIYLGVKGMLFAKSDFASKIDVLCSIYIVLVALNIFTSPTVSLIVFIWLVQKAAFALLPIR